jgi:hypothetical protein
MERWSKQIIFSCISQSQRETDTRKKWKIIKIRYNDVEDNVNFLTHVNEKRSVSFYCEMKPKWRKDKCIDGRKRNERVAESRDLKM